MGRDAPDEASSDPNGDDVLALLRAALARIDQLEAQVSALRSSADVEPIGIAPRDGTDARLLEAPASAAAALVDRRRALKGAVLAAGAAAAGVVLGDGAPAAAVDGSALILGSQLQGCTSSTAFAVTGTAAGVGLGVVDNSRSTFGEVRPAVSGYARGQNFNTGVEGAATAFNTGVRGTAEQGSAVYGEAGSGTGVYGTASTGGTGVAGVRTGSGSTGAGVFGSGGGAIGVRATSSTNTALQANSVSGTGAVIRSESARGADISSSATAVVASGGNYGVIAQSTSTDPFLAGLFATSTAALGIDSLSSNGTSISARSTTGGGVQVDAPRFHLRLQNSKIRSAPTGDAVFHQAGDVVFSTDGTLWGCVQEGTPGVWRKLGGPATAGQFHVLPAPVRVYDSRSGTNPSQGPKTKLSGNVARPIDCTVNGSGVPKGATAVFLTVLAVNAFNGNGNLTIWPNGAARPSGNTLVWGAGNGRWTTTAISGLDANARLQVAASASTDLVLDVVGYYR
jgi:hypothetical protein